MSRQPQLCTTPTSVPIVTVAVASFNSKAYLYDALVSALGQTLRAIEVIVVDDASHDGSIKVASELAISDSRLRVEVLATNRGPSGARNRALDLARGRWFAVLDSDDLMHPDRLSRLVHAAEAKSLDIIADDLVIFSDGCGPVRRFFRADRHREMDLGLAQLLVGTRLLRSVANLGYLKPLFSTEAVRRSGIRYDEALRIGEDEDFLRRLLADGLVAKTVPELTYFYRKHEASISHRLTSEAVQHMALREERFARGLKAPSLEVKRALRARRVATADAYAFVSAMEMFKGRQPFRAIGVLALRPGSLWLLHWPIAARLLRVAPRRTLRSPSHGAPRLCVLSRQRLVGAVNGSSAYLLGLASAYKRAGFQLNLLQPSPAVFGRWPVLKLHSEMAVFDDIKLRSSVRLGSYLVALNVEVWLRAAKGALAVMLKAGRMPTRWIGDGPAPYAPAADWHPEDLLYVSNHGPRDVTDGLLLDYAFQVEALPYVLPARGPSAILMHDLLHARAEAFTTSTARDSVTTLDADAERALLQQADAVFAIQAEEAHWVHAAVAGPDCILAPMAAMAVRAPQIGVDELIGFVGSNTAPNIIGLRWFFDRVWPRLLALRPGLHLEVAGSVHRGFPGDPPPNVRFLGVLPDLAAFYSRQGTIISPLTVGSGLKIKLVEAIAAGKAVVATSISLQGVNGATRDAVMIADSPENFTSAVLELAADPVARAALGERALRVARELYSAEACYQDAVHWFQLRLQDQTAVAGRAVSKRRTDFALVEDGR